MGTGVTAGVALDTEEYPQVTAVVTCELSPPVVTASRKYFSGYQGGKDLTNGLYVDPRAKVLVEDGRNHLMATDQRYSMINADLFLPYRRGAGDLYSREHFQCGKDRLRAGGVFVQWLPLYQLTELEFGIIARTMLAVFPQVSLWRGYFQPGAEIAALVGHADMSPLLACGLEKHEALYGAIHREMHDLELPINEQSVLFFYGGNLTNAAGDFAQYPINTDDHPVIEFSTPRSLHRAEAGGKVQFSEGRFADLVERVLQKTPLDEDPLLVLRDAKNRLLAHAGCAFHRASIARMRGDEDCWQREWEIFRENWLGQPFAGSEK